MTDQQYQENDTTQDEERIHDLRSKVVRLTDFVDRYIPPVEWLIEGWWVHGAKGLITGLPKARKSTIALEMAVSITHGVPFLDLYDVKQPPVPVLFIQEELDESEAQQILNAILVERGIRWYEQDQFSYEAGWHDPRDYVDHYPEWIPQELHLMSNGRFNLTSPADMNFLAGQIEEHKYKYVFIDPLFLSIGNRDLNNNVDITVVTNALNWVMRETGCAPIVVHHDNKAGEYFGSTFIRAWHQCHIQLTKNKPGDKTTADFELRGMAMPERQAVRSTELGRWEIAIPGTNTAQDRMQDNLDFLGTLLGTTTAGADIKAKYFENMGKSEAARMAQEAAPDTLGDLSEKQIKKYLKTILEPTDT